jgi:UDP-glucose 4-epimerase
VTGALTRHKPPIAATRALITGGAGFIGSHLAEALLARGDRVSVIDDLSTGSLDNITRFMDHPRFDYTVDQVTNSVVIDQLVSESDVVFHLAASVGVELIVEGPAQVIENNIFGTHAVLEAAMRHRTKVLLTSTSEIYGKNTKLPFAEDDDRTLGPTINARWSYAESKAIDEFLALAYHSRMGLPIVIVRLFNTVGPQQTGQYGMVVPRFVRQAITGQPLTVFGDGQQSRCFCDVADAVRAIIGLTDSPDAIGRIFNVGSTSEITIEALARTVLTLVDGEGADANQIVFVPYEEAYEVGFEDMRRRVPDISRVRHLIGWEPRIPLEETLRRVIATQKESNVR